MSMPVCTSKLQCQLNGLFGVAVFMSAMVLGWAAYEAAGAGMTGGAALRLAALLAPTLVSLVYAASLQWRGRVPGWAAFAVTVGGTVWGVFVLNGVARL